MSFAACPTFEQTGAQAGVLLGQFQTAIPLCIQPQRRRSIGRMQGLGQVVVDDSLRAIIDLAEKAQVEHANILADRAAKFYQELRASVSGFRTPLMQDTYDRLHELRQRFTTDGLRVVGVTYPQQLTRTNPAHAILLAVRDDIADSIAKFEISERNARQGVRFEQLMKSVARPWAILPGISPLPEAFRIPWWVWGIAIALGYSIVRQVLPK